MSEPEAFSAAANQQVVSAVESEINTEVQLDTILAFACWPSAAPSASLDCAQSTYMNLNKALSLLKLKEEAVALAYLHGCARTKK